MDAARLTELKAEINALAKFLSDYDTSVTNYLDGSSPTCVHFLDVIPTLKNDATSALASDAAWSGQGSSYGALVDFIYEVSAIQRSTPILNNNKLSYYIIDDTQKSKDADYNNGEAAKTISYLLGISPDLGITI